MEKKINLKLFSLIIFFIFPFITFSQSKDIKKLYELFEEKKWNEFDLKYSEIVNEHNLSFEQIYSYKGVLDNDAFELYKSTNTLVQVKRNSLRDDKELNNKTKEVLILSYLKILKTIENEDTSNYIQNIGLSRNLYLMTTIGAQNCSGCDYKKTLEKLPITEISSFRLMRKCDSLIVEYVNLRPKSKSIDLLNLKSKLNCSKLYTQLDRHIQTKEEDEAVASKDLNTLVKVLKKYPKSTRRPELLVYYDDFYFDYAKRQGTFEAYKSYMNDLPNGKYVNQVKRNIEDLHFGKAINSTDINYIKQVIATYSNNEKVNQLQYHLEELEFENANNQGENGLKTFIQTYPKSIFALKAKDLIIDSSIQQAINSSDILALQSFIQKYPNHSKLNEMKDIVKDAETRALKLSTYSGNYFDGKSTYEYYVNTDGNRVMHGKFEFQQGFYDTDMYSGLFTLKLDFLTVQNFPDVINPAIVIHNRMEYFTNMTSFIWFLGGTPTGKFTGSFKHGKKDGVWKYEYYNEYTYKSEVLTLVLKNDLLVSASYSVTNKKYKLPSSGCFACEEIRLTILPTGFEGEYYYANGNDYIMGNYLNGQENGTWRQYVKYFDPEADPEEINFNSETFPADITLIYSNGKLVSSKIRNQETGQLYTPTE
jgi:hypothetical protein